MTPETSGFRFRPKAFMGVLPLKLIDDGFKSSLDVGVMLDLAYIQWANLNVYAGIRLVVAPFHGELVGLRRVLTSRVEDPSVFVRDDGDRRDLEGGSRLL